MKVDKKLLKDTMGRPLTQGLFLEIGYDTKYAVFTLDDEDKTYNGVVYPSLKKLYLSCEDPTEYKFAKTYLLNWQHWKRLNANKVLKEYFDEWREELEIMLRSEGVLNILDMQTEGNFQAAKWVADRGWEKRGAGRPLKADVQREVRINERIADALNEDVDRMEKFDA
jgi:hypothetical protein